MGREAGGAGGGAGSRTTKSLRKERGQPASASEEKKSILEPKRVATNAAFAIVVVVALLLILRDGGAAQAGNATNNPAVTDWALYVVAADGSRELLCDHASIHTEDPPPAGATACTEEEMRAAHAAGHTCHVETRVHLASKGNPMLLVGMHDVRVNLTTISFGAAESDLPLNISTSHAEWVEPWEGGWWLRAFPERLDVSYDVPCYLFSVTLSLELTGRGWTGSAWEGKQNANLVFYVPDPASFARAASPGMDPNAASRTSG